jgi:hypothetical protein
VREERDLAEHDERSQKPAGRGQQEELEQRDPRAAQLEQLDGVG